MKLRNGLRNLLTLVLLTLSSIPASFAFWPVIDPTEIARTETVIKSLSEQYDTLKKQYDQMQKQYAAMSGNYGWGSWHNSAADLTQRQWSPSDWKSALEGMAGGNPERYQELLREYQSMNASMSESAYAKGSDSNLAKSYQNQVKTTQTSYATATYEFNDINRHLKNLYELSQQIEDKQNSDMKSAMDLNSRIQIESSYIAMEEVKMSALLNQQMAQVQSQDIASENEASAFNQAGE
jgi:hypothetical protein